MNFNSPISVRIKRLPLLALSGFVLLVAANGLLGHDRSLAAQSVGVTSAVLPQANSTRPNEETLTLRIGVDIVANERVVTDAKGKLQLLFLDGSALTVGPNSEVVVDEFVYDPKAKTGSLAFSATKGVFRLVGGKISKKKAVLLRTPESVIGIRGGIAAAQISPEKVTATFIFGERMTVESSGATVAVTRPGFQISAQAGQAPSAPVRASEKQLTTQLNALESDQTQDDAPDVPVGDEDVSNTQLAAMGSDAEPIAVAVNDLPPPPPPGDTARIEGNVDVVTASQQMVADNNTGGLTLTGFYGRAKRGTSTLTGTLDTNSTQNFALSNVAISNGRFSANSSQGSFSLRGPSATGSFALSAGDSTAFGAVSGNGLLSSDQSFLLYELTGSRQLVFAGLPTPSTAFPTTGVTTYLTRNDFTLGGSKIPLIPYAHGGNLTPLKTPNAMIYWGATGSGAHPGFLSANLAIVGTGSAQKHAVSLMVGEILTDGSSRRFFIGDAVGTSLISSTADYYGYFGEVASLDVGDGSDFFGTSGPHHAVIGAEDVNSLDVTSSFGLTESQRSADTTIFPNIPISSTNNAAGLGVTRSTRIMSAYVGGVSRDFSSGGTFLGVHKFYSINTTGGNNFIQTSAANNTVQGSFNIMSPFANGVPATLIDFGGIGTSFGDDSTFIDDGHFGAIGFDSGSPIEPDIGVFRDTDISLAGITPSGVTICTCAYVTWGFWGAGIDPSTEHDIGLATWVAGERVANSNLNYTATGTYSGTLIGSVANGPNTSNGSVAIYTAVGSYSFALSIGVSSLTATSGSLSIDGATMTFTGSGAISGTTPTEVVGTLSGTRGETTLSGTIRSAFFGTPANSSSAPRNAAGFFAAADSAKTYQVSGIHFSQLQP
ncbi:MAG: hypothetical protein HN834_11080 [Rhodospirillaceae bacterium]|nr:hypothetical protein [Rhodospirillaceae bacterium]MBT5081180.1 hypothetical protein [Rhodospirillaceae bacterium]MBT5880513.1 hypothetical protein [Rhodospirillaceae bacterium]MBT6591731.1 hypothetical protein [Rhodospirillaceae bacterium]MBT7285988.1 hypothetical protein [Rhodospirillaceae bacterium]